MKRLLILSTLTVLAGCSEPVNLQIYADKHLDTKHTITARPEPLNLLATRYGLPTSLVAIVRRKESSSGQNTKPRFEPHCMRYKQLQKYDTKTRRVLCTSWGDMQVMGFHALDYGLNIDELISDRELQQELGFVLLAKHWHKYSDLPLKKRIYQTCRRYNGTGKLADKYARDCLELYENGMI